MRVAVRSFGCALLNYRKKDMRNIKVKAVAVLIAAAMLLTGCGENERTAQTGDSSTQTVSSSGDTSSVESRTEPNSSEVPPEPEKPKTMDMFEVLPEIPVTDVSAFEYRIEQDGVIITDFLTDDTAIRIPDKIDGKPVVALRLNEDLYNNHDGDLSYDDVPEYKKYSITELILPDTVTTIYSTVYCVAGEYEPSDAPALNKVEYMNYPAKLSSCSCELASLKKLYIDENTKVVKSNIRFSSDLTDVYIPTTVTASSSDVFKTCIEGKTKVYYNGETYNGYTKELHHLINDVYGDGFFIIEVNNNGDARIYLEGFYSDREDVVVPDGVTNIGMEVFDSNTTMKTVTIPASVEYIYSGGENTTGGFYGCSSLISVSFEKGSKLKEIGTSAFNGCTSLTNVTFDSDVIHIGYGAFRGCTSLERITIPNSVTYIGENAFAECTSLTSINIPDGITSINNGVFYDCTSLESIEIPDSVTSIGNWAFRECTSLTSITIPNSVTKIGDYAFKDCTNITEITLSDDISSSDLSKWKTALSDCIDNSNLEIKYQRNVFSSFQQVISFMDGYDIDGFKIEDGVLLSYIGSEKNIVIPDGVKEIASGAFARNDNIVSITVPASVKTIEGGYCAYYEKGAFYRCYNLKSVVFEGTLNRIALCAWGYFESGYKDEIQITYKNKTYNTPKEFFDALDKNVDTECYDYEYEQQRQQEELQQ